jgi:hypothetical protein
MPSSRTDFEDFEDIEDIEDIEVDEDRRDGVELVETRVRPRPGQ